MNKYDIKYIIKKILIYSGVALILMFVKSCDIKALNVYNLDFNSVVCPGGQTSQTGEWRYCQNSTDNYYRFNNSGTIPEGYYDISFQIQSSIGQNITASIRDVSCQINGTDMARIGQDTYSTSGIFYTVKCENVPLVNGLNQLYLKTYSLGTLSTAVNIYNSVVPHGSDNTGVSSAINNQTQQQHQDSQDIKNTLTNDNVDNQQSTDFFNNFGSTTNQGLQDLIKKPIDIIDSFYNSCSPITFNIPYFDTTITLPCISSIQNDFTSVIFPIIRVIINGLLCYRILTKFIDEINKLKDPNSSDLEVVDL